MLVVLATDSTLAARRTSISSEVLAFLAEELVLWSLPFIGMDE